MGKLIEGIWHDVWYPTAKNRGQFVREDAHFRHTIGAQGGNFPVEAGRYHLYVSYACPWAHRTLVTRQLKGLSGVISSSVVEPEMLKNGWAFSSARPEPNLGVQFMHQLYTHSVPTYTGRVTVPVLWDKHSQQIVNNESSEIIRMMDGPFAQLGTPGAPTLWPVELREDIEQVNQLVYKHINNGVYRAGFATTQEAYETAVHGLFASLDTLETRLAGQKWLVGGQLTEADIRLYVTLVRFDAVYHGHFKCNLKSISGGYPNLWAHTRRVHQLPGVAQTLHLEEAKRHYYYSHRNINPTGVVPVGPHLDLLQPTP